jgi:hypothetical protein
MTKPRWMMGDTLIGQVQAERARREIDAAQEAVRPEAADVGHEVDLTHGVQMSDAKAIETFLFAGHAKFTLVSLETGRRFTYKIATARGKETEGPWFVSLLTGPDNTRDYTFMGTCFAGRRFEVRTGRKSPPNISGTDGYKALEWFLEKIVVFGRMPKNARFFHAGACGRCGRVLTVPSSIESGIGPDCAQIMEGP